MTVKDYEYRGTKQLHIQTASDQGSFEYQRDETSVPACKQ